MKILDYFRLLKLRNQNNFIKSQQFYRNLECRVQLIKNYLELNEYKILQKEFQKRYRKYRKEYLLNIQEYTEDYPEDTIYKIHKSLRE